MSILFETDDFIALDKPAGLLSIPDREGKEPSLKSLLRDQYGNIFTVHRLDRDTSGVIVFAKNEATHKYLSKIFEDRSVEKIYQGIVQGTPPQQKAASTCPSWNTRPNPASWSSTAAANLPYRLRTPRNHRPLLAPPISYPHRPHPPDPHPHALHRPPHRLR